MTPVAKRPARARLATLAAGLIAAWAAGPVPAGPPSPGSAEDPEMLALMATLEEATEIATKTRMNADYVPGAVSVLHGDDLEDLGITTVWEALGTVPGLQTTRTNFGEPLVLVRGAGYSLHSGNLKILLNSVPMNNDIDGHAFPVLTLPVEQVERIEVFRGPGSALYGEYAYAGVVNVITRKDRQRVYARAAQYDTLGAGVMAHQGDGESGLRLYGNLSGWHTDGAGTDSGPDGVHGDGLGFSPGEVDDEEGNRFALLGMEYAGYSLTFQYARHEKGDFFGLDALPPPDRRSPGHAENLGFDLDKNWQLAPAARLHGRLLWQTYASESPLHMSRPPGAELAHPPGRPPIFTTVGTFVRRSVDTRRYGAESELNWSGWEDHRLLLGLSYTHTEITGAWVETNVVVDPPPARELDGLERFSDGMGWVHDGIERDLYSLTLQDQWTLGGALELTGGLRLDSYSDVGDSLTPRLAGVWRLADRHILKAQYAEAFRPPTLAELYQDNRTSHHLEPETLASTELSYIYRRAGSRGQLTLFHTRLDNLITFRQDRDQPYVNLGEIRLQGVEAEWDQPLDRGWLLKSNLSYTDTHDRETGERVPGSAEWLANALLEGPVSDRLRLGLRWRYVGERARWATDDREDLSGYQTLDLTLSWSRAANRGLTLRAGVKNLFDQDERALAAVDTYQEDLPQPGRTWWLQVGYALE